MTWSDIARKLTSRKLWVSIAGFVAGILTYTGAATGSVEAISDLIIQFASIIGYLLAEGLVDAKHAETGTAADIVIEMIEDEILNRNYKANDIIISTTAISKLLSVNTTSAAKAVSILNDEGILYKRIGVGICVVPGAIEKLISRRKELFFEESIPSLLKEANKLDINDEEFVQIIKEFMHDKANKRN